MQHTFSAVKLRFFAISVNTLPFLSIQQFCIWLDSSSPEQTVPYLWTEEKPASKSSCTIAHTSPTVLTSV